MCVIKGKYWSLEPSYESCDHQLKYMYNRMNKPDYLLSLAILIFLPIPAYYSNILIL